MVTHSLAALSDEQHSINQALVQLLGDEIAQHGPMPFAEYMHRCLYEPGLGYYVNGLSKLGAAGDFVTAPELSADFASCIAAQSVEVLQEIGGGSVLEFGGGTGQLAVDVLTTLDRLNTLPEHYYLLDVSPDLKHTQQQKITSALPEKLVSRVQWVDSFVAGFRGVVIANELFDAFPVQRFSVTDTDFKLQCVDWNGQQFSYSSVSDQATSEHVENIQQYARIRFAAGYQSEFCPVIVPWWNSLSESIDTAAVLVCDYGCERAGYYAPRRAAGSLRCFFRHQVHDDALIYQGVQDITADVDFTAVAEAATGNGFALEGYTSMTQFMLSLGALERHQQSLESLNERATIEATGRLKQVLLPEEMGERFMVAGFSKNISPALRGFSAGDQSRLL